jgi:hypothetical protein
MVDTRSATEQQMVDNRPPGRPVPTMSVLVGPRPPRLRTEVDYGVRAVRPGFCEIFCVAALFL